LWLKSQLDCGFCAGNRASMFGYSCSFALGELPLRFGLAALCALGTSPPAVFCQRLSSAGWAALVGGGVGRSRFVVCCFLVFASPCVHQSVQRSNHLLPTVVALRRLLGPASGWRSRCRLVHHTGTSRMQHSPNMDTSSRPTKPTTHPRRTRWW